MGVSSLMRGSSPRMTQVCGRTLNKVIAGLDPAIHDAVHTRLSHSVAPRLNEVIAGLDRQSMMPFTLV